MAQLVALLRGINVGPAKRIAMGDLRAALASAGFEGVGTVGQSGNAIVSSERSPEAVSEAVEALIEERFGLSVAVVVRTVDELRAALAADPLVEPATDGSRHHVIFLSSEPEAAALEELLERDFGEERVAARGRELYTWTPDGVHDSALMKAIEKARLAPVGTARNVNTLAKIVAKAQAPAPGSRRERSRRA